MENNLESGSVKLHFSLTEEKECYTSIRSQLIKLLYMIESEQESGNDISLWFYGFMFDLASANVLCSNKLTRVVIKIHGLYDNKNYKTMTHAQIKRQIMEAKGIVDHLIKELEGGNISDEKSN